MEVDPVHAEKHRNQKGTINTSKTYNRGGSKVELGRLALLYYSPVNLVAKGSLCLRTLQLQLQLAES